MQTTLPSLPRDLPARADGLGVIDEISLLDGDAPYGAAGHGDRDATAGPGAARFPLHAWEHTAGPSEQGRSAAGATAQDHQALPAWTEDLLDRVQTHSHRTRHPGMDPEPPLPKAPAIDPGAVSITPTDIAAALLRSSHLTLEVGPELKPPGSWMRPGMMFVGQSMAPQEMTAALRKGVRLKKWVWITCVLLLNLSALFAIKIWAESSASSRASIAGSGTIAWSVTGVSDAGVTIELRGRVGSSDAASTTPATAAAAAMQRTPSPSSPSTAVLIPIGALLPNGERLQATLAERNTYITSAGAIVTLSASSANP